MSYHVHDKSHDDPVLVQALPPANENVHAISSPVLEPSKPAARQHMPEVHTAKQAGQKRQQGSDQGLQPLPKQQKTVYKALSSSSSTEASSLSEQSQPVDSIRPAQPDLPKAPAKQDCKVSASAQKENQPVNKLRSQPPGHAASIYATRHASASAPAKALRSKKTPGSIPNVASAPVQKTTNKREPAGHPQTYSRKRPAHVQPHHDVPVQSQRRRAGSQVPQSKAIAPVVSAPSAENSLPRHRTTAKSEAARQSSKAFDALLTAMLSQDEATNFPILPAKTATVMPNTATANTNAVGQDDAPCMTAASHGVISVAADTVLGSHKLEIGDSQAAAQAKAIRRQQPRRTSVQAPENKQGLGAGLFSTHVQVSQRELHAYI